MTALGKTLSELASYVNGRVIGDGGVVISKVCAIDEAGPGDITFLANPRYAKFLQDSKASAVIVIPGIAREQVTRAGQSYLEVADPYVAFAKILELLSPAPSHEPSVSPLAHIEQGAIVGDEVTIFPYVFIGRNTKIGARSVLFPGVVLAEEVEVGDDCVFHSHVVVREQCRIGQRVILHAGVVIGSDGFGYAGEGDHRVKIPQVGIVEVQDDVEIGANTTIDRATFGRTLIGRGTKIDNLVQIAHNVTIGENSVIAAQVGIAGSTQVGRDVTLAGQVGVVNHIKIGDGAKIGPQSGIPRSVPAGSVLSGGIGAAPHHEWLRVMTLLPELPKLWKTVRSLEKKLAELMTGGGKER